MLPWGIPLVRGCPSVIDAVRRIGLVQILDTVPGITGATLADPALFAAQRSAVLEGDDLSYLHLQFEPLATTEKDGTRKEIGIFSLDGTGQVSFRVEQMLDEPGRYLFLKTPANGTYLTPTWKLVSEGDKKGRSDSKKLLKTIEAMRQRAETDPQPWLQDLLRIFTAQEVILPDPEPDGTFRTAPFLAAARWAAQTRHLTVFSVRLQGRYPGDIPSLAHDALARKADTIFQTAGSPAHEGGTCTLCRREGKVYPNVLSGCGFNLLNVDKPGFFPDCDPAAAWQVNPICRECGEQIYVARWRVFPRLTRRVCGRELLAIPHLLDGEDPGDLLRALVADYDPESTPLATADTAEQFLYDALAQSRAVATVTYLVGTIAGQDVKDISRVIPNVIPSRLGAVADAIRAVNAASRALPDDHPFAFYGLDAKKTPVRRNPVTESLTILQGALGTRKQKGAGAAYTAMAVNYDDLLLAILTGQPYPTRPLFADFAGKLLHDLRQAGGDSPAAQVGTITRTARAMHITLSLLHRLKTISLPDGVNYVTSTLDRYEPLAPLNQFLTTSPGIDSREKTFAFLLGLLAGKLVSIQLGRRVNPESLRWIAATTFSERDLRDLFVRVRSKLDQYSSSQGETAWSAEMRGVAEALAVTGAGIQKWSLSRDEAAYWFAVGHSLQPAFLPTKEELKTTSAPAEVLA